MKESNVKELKRQQFTEKQDEQLQFAQKRKKVCNIECHKPLILLVPRARLELAQPQGPRDFKSLASTNSATQA